MGASQKRIHGTLSKARQRKYLTAIGIDRGIIVLIEEDGTIGTYHQRGLKGIEKDLAMYLIRKGDLREDYLKYPELPVTYSISFEHPCMGRARATFPNLGAIKEMWRRHDCYE